MFWAHVTWALVAEGDGFAIASKRVDLLNSDQESGHLRIAMPI